MKFSIIIPAHNSAKYIRKCLGSIKRQTFKDYELIVVCDSCTDDTAEIAKEYGAKVYEVNFHQDGQTRNVGIEHAIGEWVLFLDDDDWWLHEFVLELLNGRVGKDGEDILAFSFIWKGVGYTSNVNKLWIATWNKCWRREAIGNTRFSKNDFDSDVAFHEGMMKKDLNVSVWDMPMYYYNYMRKGSQTEKHSMRGGM